MATGPVWKQQRRFTLQVFRNFGVGRFLMETKLHSEIDALLGGLERKINENNGIVDVVQSLQLAVVNIIYNILLGKRFDHEDPEFLEFRMAIGENFRLLGKTLPLNNFPFLRYLIPGGLGFWKMMENIGIVDEFLLKQISAHYDEIVQRNEQQKDADDFCAAYLIEMEKLKKTNDENQHMFNFDQLRGIIRKG